MILPSIQPSIHPSMHSSLHPSIYSSQIHLSHPSIPIPSIQSSIIYHPSSIIIYHHPSSIIPSSQRRHLPWSISSHQCARYPTTTHPWDSRAARTCLLPWRYLAHLDSSIYIDGSRERIREVAVESRWGRCIVDTRRQHQVQVVGTHPPPRTRTATSIACRG